MNNIPIDLTGYFDQLKIKIEDGQKYVVDPTRNVILKLLPEELVRQLFLQYLISTLKYSKNRIKSEFSIKLNKMEKRCDIVIFDQYAKPQIIVECKSTKIKITQQTFDQIAHYNMVLKVKYLIVTNGIETYCCINDYENNSYKFLDFIPNFEQIV
jgi:hypothetical protein